MNEPVEQAKVTVAPVRTPQRLTRNHEKLVSQLQALAVILAGQNRPMAGLTCEEAADSIMQMEAITTSLSHRVIDQQREIDQLQILLKEAQDPRPPNGRIWTIEKVEPMAQLRRQGATLAAIADQYNLTRGHVRILLERHANETGKPVRRWRSE